jgi:hypothetical protein
MTTRIVPTCGVLFGLVCLCAIGCDELQGGKPADTVTIPQAEYQGLKRRAELEKKYEATFQLRRQILQSRLRGETQFPVNSLFNACGDTLDPNGEIFDPKNWPDAPAPSATPVR